VHAWIIIFEVIRRYYITMKFTIFFDDFIDHGVLKGKKKKK